MDEYSTVEKTRKIRELYTVKPTKHEGSQQLHSNKKYWTKVFSEMHASTLSQENESKQLLKVLPKDLYEKVCKTLDIPILSPDNLESRGESEKSPRRMLKEPLLSYRKTLYIDREMDSDTDVELYSSDDEEAPNIHQEFLKKPVREQVTWPTRFLRPEREDEKSLVKKADDLTDRIAQDFCEYMKQLGGNQQSQLFTPKAIKELFQIEFDTHVARSLRVVPKELPTVGEKVAQVAGKPEKSRLATLEREVLKDIKAESRSDNLKAFGRSVPRKDQWRAPRNDTKDLWRSARRVPKDLVTLKTVWEGITNLRSVKEYCRWMISHPEYRRAPYLSSLGMFDSAVLDARCNYGMKNSSSAAAVEASAPIDKIRERISNIVDSI